MLIKYKCDEAENFRLMKIINGEINFFLPLNIICESKDIIGIYKCSGYTRLNDIYFDDSKIFDFAIMFFKMLEELRDQLFFPDKMILSANNVFLNDNLTDIRTVYIRDESVCSEKSSIIGLFLSIKKNCKNECKAYVDNIVRVYEKEYANIYRLSAALNEMKRDLLIL